MLSVPGLRRALQLYLAPLLALVLVGCATSPPPPAAPARGPTPFSHSAAGAELPSGWQPWIINRTKLATRYELVHDAESRQVVLKAHADHSASGLKQLLEVDPAERPLLRWRWKLTDLIASADNQDRWSEDSPARVMLFFDGDRSALPFKEQMLAEAARLISGHEVPYATLVYVWENRFAPGTVLPSHFSGQIKMVVAGTGRDGLGQWQTLQRDYVADFTRAFGKPPGRLVGIGVMTDTDNTGETVEAYYGDIELAAR